MLFVLINWLKFRDKNLEIIIVLNGFVIIIWFKWIFFVWFNCYGVLDYIVSVYD